MIIPVTCISFPVGREVSPQMHLIDYLRNELHLTGAKAVCREGGCGACTVVATVPDPEDPENLKTFSVNAVSVQVVPQECGTGVMSLPFDVLKDLKQIVLVTSEINIL